MEISTFNVTELSAEELSNINGGSKIGDFFAAVGEFFEDAYIWVRDKILDWYLTEYRKYLESRGVPLL